MEIKKFPTISEDSLIISIQKTINNNQTRLAERIIELQNNCQHELEKIYEYPKKIWENEKGAVIAKECKKCGFTIQRPKGSSEKVCDVCWGEMEYLGREPGQGGGTHHYECKTCHHHHTST